MTSLNKRVINNATWIIGAKIVQSLLALVISTLTVRYLGPSNYGLISYAASLVNFVTPITQLGLNNILVQEFVDTPEEDGDILGTSLIMSFISAIAAIIGITAFVSITNAGETVTVTVCFLYSLLLIMQAMELSQYWFQARLAAKYVSIASLIAYLTVSAYKIFLLATKKSIYWFALSNVFDYAIIAVVLLIIYKKLSTAGMRCSFSTAKRLLSKSRHYILANMMVSIFSQTDRIMLKLMVNNESTGYYSAAAVCATFTYFIFSAILDSMRPVIFESKKESKEKYEKNISRLYCIVFYLTVAQGIFITALAPFIVNLLYGSAYGETVNILKVLVWYSVFSYIGTVRSIWMLAENKQRYLWIINLSGAVINVILNFILIPILGAVGAAITSLVTQIFIDVIIGYIIRPISYNNKLLLKGLNPLLLIEIIKTVLRKTNNKSDGTTV